MGQAGKELRELEMGPAQAGLGLDWRCCPGFTFLQELSPSHRSSTAGTEGPRTSLHEAEAVIRVTGQVARARRPRLAPSSAAHSLTAAAFPGFHPVSFFANGGDLGCPDCYVWVSR